MCTRYYSSWYSTLRNKILWFLFASYNVTQPNLQNKYNNCMQTFLVRHAFSCSNRDLLIACHNGIHDNIIHLAKKVFFPNFVHKKSLIHLVCSRSKEEVRHGGSVAETRCGVSIQSLWESQI